MGATENPQGAAPSRLERRKQHTHDAILTAARDLLLAEGTDVAVQDITDRADVAVASFYNHFAGKQEVFRAVAAGMFAEFEDDLAERTAGLSDPAEVPCVGFRLILRLPETRPDAAKVLGRIGPLLVAPPKGYSPAFERDVRAAMDAGRFRIRNLHVTLTMVAGGFQQLLQMRLADPSVGTDVVDEAAQIMLEMFGMSANEARRLAHKRLPPAPRARPARRRAVTRPARQ